MIKKLGVQHSAEWQTSSDGLVIELLALSGSSSSNFEPAERIARSLDKFGSFLKLWLDSLFPCATSCSLCSSILEDNNLTCDTTQTRYCKLFARFSIQLAPLILENVLQGVIDAVILNFL